LLDEVLRQRRLLEDSFNSLADLVIVTDASHRVVQVNDACVDRLSATREQMLGRPLSEIAGPVVAAWAADDADSNHQPREQTSLRSHTFDDLPVPGTFAATVTPLINEDDEIVGQVLVARDITEHARLETEREALRERLAQSEKLAALGQFVAGIAHEMNNPLQGIMGHLELLIDHSADAQPVRAELRRIFREADRASRIVRNLLVFTGSRRMTRRRLRIDRVIARALASRSAALERAGITVVRRFPESLPSVTGDPLLLQQAFLNILINAEHAIDSGSGPRIIETSASVNGNHEVVATIRDTGTGIPPDVLPRIFDPFFSTKEVGKGTGLGLAITYGIVQEHDGTIQASNAPDGGAVFTIAFPVSAEVK
jgi:PAS domain S-box-containing protein